MSSPLSQTIEQISREKHIEPEIIVAAIEDAMVVAARKYYKTEEDLRSKFNVETGHVDVFAVRQVVEEVTDPTREITLGEARKQDPAVEVGGEVLYSKPTDVLGRIAAQTAKQVIMQKVREAERDTIFNEYNGRVGEMLNCIVKRTEGPDLIVDLGRTEARLPKREQSRLEAYNVGDRKLAVYFGSTITYYHADHLSNRRMSNGSGSGTTQLGNFPFGEACYGTGAKWRFTSYERDTETGNDYAIFRSYVNRLGRFSSPDPIAGSIGNPQSFNRFAYSRSDPVNLKDPSGLLPCGDEGGSSSSCQLPMESDAVLNTIGSTNCVQCQFPVWMLIDRSFADARDQLNIAIQQAAQNGQSVNVVVSGGALAFASEITQTILQGAQPFGAPVFTTIPSGTNTLTVALNEPAKNFLQYGTVTNPNTDAGCAHASNACALSYIAPQPLDDFKLTLYLAGQMASPVGEGKFIAGWYVASAAAGFGVVLAHDITLVQAGRYFGTRYMGNSPLWNTGDAFRIGWKYMGGNEYVFRVTGDILDGAHIYLWPWP